MANIKSQIKRNRQNEIRRQRNKAVRSELKTRIKATREAVQAESADAAAIYRETQTKIDIAATKGILHKRTASRRKSRLAKKLNA